jgi:murein DD-endopeptidase MepM/ murein hydrolase activator NlpD
MIAEISRWGSKLFPEIHIGFATKAPVSLSPWAHAALLSMLVLGAAALAFLGISRLGYERLAAKQQAAIVRAETASANLRDDVAGLQNKLAGLARDREQAQSRVAALASQADTLRGRLDTTEAKLQSLDQTRQALGQARAESAALTARLGKSEADRAAEAAQFAQYKASLEETAKKLQQLDAVRGQGATYHARLRARLGELWQKLSQVQMPQPEQQLASSAAPKGDAVASPGRNGGTAFERVLASTGVDVARLFSHFAVNRGEGGPFVPPPKDGPQQDAVDPDKLATMRGLANVLPLGAPLPHYTVGSPFGPRVDPFNRRAAFHTGVDMDAPYLSPVYATAPGTVIYAGYLGDYGKVVEIDHGFGIDTLYAHLHRCLVAVGQQVAARAEIGLLGTTGRSSGPHVHYEVRVNGVPQDPEKFIGLPSLIPVSARQFIPEATAPTGNSH